MKKMNANISIGTTARFHSFDLARELLKVGRLKQIYSAYPAQMLRNEQIPSSFLTTYPVSYLTARAMRRVGVRRRMLRSIERFATQDFARRVATSVGTHEIYTGMSGISLEPGRRAQQLGGAFVCRRGSSHILTQDALLRSEYARLDLPYEGIDPWIIDRELEEYARADLIEVPSSFAAQTFVQRGTPEDKIILAPLGVNLSRFASNTLAPDGYFNVLFVGQVSIRKGIHILLDSFQRVDHPRKSLTIVGAIDSVIMRWIEEKFGTVRDVTFTGPVPQHTLVDHFRHSHLLVLPSVEDGFGMVMAQAMAAECPVLASAHTGAFDLLDASSGFIVEPGNVDAFASKMQALADDPDLQTSMGGAAGRRVADIDGWTGYAQRFLHAVDSSLEIGRS